MDTILINGKFYTMDKGRQIADSVAIKGNIIEKVGTEDEILALKTEDTKVYNLGGKTVLPGFNDSHMHLLNYGLSRRQVNLIGSTSIEEITSRVSKFIEDQDVKSEEWVMCGGWNQDYFKGERIFPTRYDLDKISTQHPIIATRVCLHVLVANSKALEMLNINKDTAQIEGGHFDLDEDGQPIGIFREKALSLIYENLPETSVEEIKDLMINAIEDMNRDGITSVGTDDFEALPDKNYDNVIRAYDELKNENKLKMRIYEQCLFRTKEDLQEFMDKGYKTGKGDENFKIGPLKLLLDGSLGARTAALVEPYTDDPTTRGITTMAQEELDEIVESAHKNNLQVAMHAIGDRTMYMVFEAIEKALDKFPRKDHRHGIVHAQITDEVLLEKFKEFQAIAYIQPIFLEYDWQLAILRIGEEREKTAYNWKTMSDKGIVIACGTDAPVEPFNVLNCIYEAVTRQDLEGNPEGGWMPEQRLSVDEALYGYTMAGAYASFEEDIKGSIEEEKLADMVVLSEDIFEVDIDRIKDLKIEATIFDGKVVFGEIDG